ncbi:hypothetical protein [Burkholderia sp. Ac-20365]|uniref:hypothetical protein n=1 Tax=Burkholderia sp. Ac-20365 TaxID=2703897 RepID=UPI00197B4988|nr:hypothetical protein [Burkholderia sp. Ac-20365]
MPVLKAQIATGAANCPSDVRRAAVALLERAMEYWRHVDYCHPMLTGSSGEIPRAIPAPQFAAQYSQLRQGLRVTDPVDGPAKVWEEAMALCLSTALQVAQWEIGKALGDADDRLRLGRIAALSACKNPEIALRPWGKTSRRITTVGIRKRISSALAQLPSTWLILHPDTGVPAFFAQSDYERVGATLQRRARDHNHELLLCPPYSEQALKAA